MNLQVEYRCIRKAIFERMPVLAAVRRMPDADVRTHVDVVRCGTIYGQSVVLDIQKAVGACRATAVVPLRSVEPPHAAAVSLPAERHIDGTTIGIGPIHRDVRENAMQVERTGRGIVKARDFPATGGAVGTKNIALGGANEKTITRCERHRKSCII